MVCVITKIEKSRHLTTEIGLRTQADQINPSITVSLHRSIQAQISNLCIF